MTPHGRAGPCVECAPLAACCPSAGSVASPADSAQEMVCIHDGCKQPRETGVCSSASAEPASHPAPVAAADAGRASAVGTQSAWLESGSRSHCLYTVGLT